MGTLTTTAREAAALTIAGLGRWISLHTADPGATGAAEAPGVARQQTTWAGGVADGVIPGSQTLHGAPSGTYSHFGVWDAETGGNFVGSGPLSAPTTLGATGEIKVTPTIRVNN